MHCRRATTLVSAAASRNRRAQRGSINRAHPPVRLEHQGQLGVDDYVNLYHWLVGDVYYRRGMGGWRFPLADKPYARLAGHLLTSTGAPFSTEDDAQERHPGGSGPVGGRAVAPSQAVAAAHLALFPAQRAWASSFGDDILELRDGGGIWRPDSSDQAEAETRTETRRIWSGRD